MKTTGRYIAVENEFDLQGEIDGHIDDLKMNLQTIKNYNKSSDVKEITKAMIEYLLETL